MAKVWQKGYDDKIQENNIQVLKADLDALELEVSKLSGGGDGGGSSIIVSNTPHVNPNYYDEEWLVASVPVPTGEVAFKYDIRIMNITDSTATKKHTFNGLSIIPAAVATTPTSSPTATGEALENGRGIDEAYILQSDSLNWELRIEVGVTDMDIYIHSGAFQYEDCSVVSVYEILECSTGVVNFPDYELNR